MISTKHGSGAGRALRLGAPAFLAAATLIGAVACSSSSSTANSSGSSPASTSSSSSGTGTTVSAAGLSAYLPGKKATGTTVKVGLINNEGSSPQSEPSVGDAAVHAKDSAQHAASATLEKAGDLGKDATDLIRRYPIPALLVGIGLGFLLGQVLHSSSKRA